MKRGEKEKPPYVDLASNIGEHDLNENSPGSGKGEKEDGLGGGGGGGLDGGRLNGGFEADEFVEGGRGELVDHQRLSEQMLGNYLQLEIPPDLEEGEKGAGGISSKEGSAKREKGIRRYLKNPSSILLS